MLERTPKTPSYRLHRASGQAVTTLSGRDCYLGRFKTAASRKRYDALIAEWLAAGRCLPDHGASEGTLIIELCVAYRNHARAYYKRPDGSRTSSVSGVIEALRPVKAGFGRTLCKNFGPLKLVAVRQAMIAEGLSRGVINQRIGCIKRMFRWGVSQELLPAEVYDALACVAGLRAGRSEAKETKPVRPVPEADIEATLRHVPRQVAALIRLQLLTAARAGELTIMRATDIDTSGKVWLFRPRQHKTLYQGRERIIYMGPKAQAVVKPFMADRSVDAYLFSAAEAVQERHADAKTHRRPRQRPNPRKSKRRNGAYTTGSYRRAIARGCRKACIPAWHPHQLRHNAATTLRREYGVEGAQLILGHSRADVTQLYAEVNAAKAVEIIGKVG